MTDEHLLRQLALGDGKAAQTLTQRLGPRAFAQAFRMLADRGEAEDVTQDALIKLWEIAPRWREGEAQISTWLYRVVGNMCIDRLRKRAPLAQDSEEILPKIQSNDASVEEVIQGKQRARMLAHALENLPDRQRQAVVLRHLEGLSNGEISQIMNIGTDAVESLTARGKRKLATLLSNRKDKLGLEL